MSRTVKTDALPAWLQWTLAGGLGLILVLMPFHAFISTWGGTAIGPLEVWKSWKEILLGLLALLTVGWLSVRPRRWKELFAEPLLWWIAAFGVVLLWLAVIRHAQNGTAATLAGLAMDGRYFVAFGLAYISFQYGNWRWLQIRRYLARYVAGIGVLIAILGIIQVTLVPHDFLTHFGYDKYHTIAPYILIDQNQNALRAFATLRGPNDFGAFLILPFILLLWLVRATKWAWVGLLVLFVATIYSASRSALIGLIVAVGAYLAIRYGRRVFSSARTRVAVVAVSVLIIGVGAVAALTNNQVRLLVFHSSPGDSSLTEGSTDNHWKATGAGIVRALQNPLGCGPGCAGPASYYHPNALISENYYVQIVEELGVTGLILWLGIVIMVAQKLWRAREDWLSMALLATLAGISIVGLLLHVWSDDPLSLTWWLLAGAVLGTYSQLGYDKHKESKQKTNNDRQTKIKAPQTRH